MSRGLTGVLYHRDGTPKRGPKQTAIRVALFPLRLAVEVVLIPVRLYHFIDNLGPLTGHKN